MVGAGVVPPHYTGTPATVHNRARSIRWPLYETYQSYVHEVCEWQELADREQQVVWEV